MSVGVKLGKKYFGGKEWDVDLIINGDPSDQITYVRIVVTNGFQALPFSMTLSPEQTATIHDELLQILGKN